MTTDQPTKYAGPRGYAERLTADPDVAGASTTVAYWLLTGAWHPLWKQFVLTVVSLRDEDGTPPARLAFPGATHELLVIALDPGDGPTARIRKPADLARGIGASGGHLLPIDVVHQFEATDDEMTTLTFLAAKACADGQLTPSTDDARERLREDWLAACVKTLAHLRGEVHAR